MPEGESLHAGVISDWGNKEAGLGTKVRSDCGWPVLIR